MIIVCGIFFASIIGVVELYVGTMRPAHVSYTDLHWEQPPGLIALNPVKKNNERGLLFLRLRDGEEQFLAGEWKTNFTPYGNVFVYGYAPNSATEKKQILYYIESGERISRITIKNQPGEIVAVQENPKTSYLFIEFTNNKRTSFCLVERYGSTGNTNCKQLDVSTIARGAWNPNAERELVIKIAGDEIYTFDPWEKRPVKISSKNPHYSELKNVFTRQPNADSSHQGIFQHSFSTILAVKEKSTIRFFRIPKSAQTTWLTDKNHILLKTKNEAGILELSTNKYVPIELNSGQDIPTIKLQGADGEYTF